MQEGGGLDFQNFIYVKLKKKEQWWKFKKKLENCSWVLSFNIFFILLKPSPPPPPPTASRLACQGEATHTHFMVNILAAWSTVNLSLDIEQLIIPTFS